MLDSNHVGCVFGSSQSVFEGTLCCAWVWLLARPSQSQMILWRMQQSLQGSTRESGCILIWQRIRYCVFHANCPLDSTSLQIIFYHSQTNLDSRYRFACLNAIQTMAWWKKTSRARQEVIVASSPAKFLTGCACRRILTSWMRCIPNGPWSTSGRLSSAGFGLCPSDSYVGVFLDLILICLSLMSNKWLCCMSTFAELEI